MGNIGSTIKQIRDKIAKLFSPDIEARVIMVGLDAAGKTTILYQIKLGDDVNTIPTIGFNVESIQYNNVNFTVWDIGGQEKIRALWKHYYTGCKAVVFVVDGADRERLAGDAKKEVQALLHEDALRDCIFLIFVNKQDLPDAADTNTVIDTFELKTIGKNRTWYVQPCTAKTGDGLHNGFDWLVTELKKKQNSRN